MIIHRRQLLGGRRRCFQLRLGFAAPVIIRPRVIRVWLHVHLSQRIRTSRKFQHLGCPLGLQYKQECALNIESTFYLTQQSNKNAMQDVERKRIKGRARQTNDKYRGYRIRYTTIKHIQTQASSHRRTLAAGAGRVAPAFRSLRTSLPTRKQIRDPSLQSHKKTKPFGPALHGAV